MEVCVLDSRLEEPPSLCLAGVLVDDIRGDGLLLLLLPHQQDALMDEHILLLHRRRRRYTCLTHQRQREELFQVLFKAFSNLGAGQNRTLI